MDFKLLMIKGTNTEISSSSSLILLACSSYCYLFYKRVYESFAKVSTMRVSMHGQ